MNHPGDQDSDAAAIHALLDQLADAWNRGDGAAYGALFTDDASYITYLGTLYTGSHDIGRAHQALFDSFLKGTRLASAILGMRFHGADTAVVTTRGDTYKNKPGTLRKLQTFTIVRTDGEWRIAAFQNTMHKRLMEALSFRFRPDSRPVSRR